MAELEPGLRAHLVAAVPGAGGRVHPDRLPDPPALPALVYQRVSTVRGVTYDGPDELVEARFQIDSWATTRAVARANARAVTDALLGYRGVMGDVLVAVPRQPVDFDSFEEDTRLYRVTAEFIIWHSEE